MGQQVVGVLTREFAPVLLGVATFGAFALPGHSELGNATPRFGLVGLAIAVVATAALWLIQRPPVPGWATHARLVMAAGAAIPAMLGARADRPAMGIAVTLILGLLAAEGLLHRVTAPWSTVVRLPSPWRPATTIARSGAVWLVNSGLVLAMAAAGVLSWPAWPVLAATVGAAALCGWLLLDGWRAWRGRHRDEMAALRHAITEYQPRFLLYFSAPPGSEYQARMWLPQLERIGQPFLVVLAEPENLAAISSSTKAPVVVVEAFEALDAVMVDSLRTVFYVNNGMKNAHCVRYAHLTHVQLYHGDSDKAVTASPVNAMFDQIFVAGQAAIDRFAAYGVHILREKFRIVGRPQVAQLNLAAGHIGTIADKVVLYAPTWKGAYADVNHCSLAIGERIVQALLDRGATVIVRAHPYTERDRSSALYLRRIEHLLARDQARSGRAHRWGSDAAQRLTLHQCMNLADAMICDVSSVASEFLYSGKPFAVTDMGTEGSALATSMPLARAAYLLAGDASNLDHVLDELLDRDPLEATRRELRSYYLGDFPPDTYADAFLAEARRCVGRAPATSLAGRQPGSVGR